MPTNKLPSKEELVSKLIQNFTKPGVNQILLGEEDFYQIFVIVEPDSLHIIDNLMELEETISLHNKVRFLYKEEWLSGESIWLNTK